MSQGVRLRVWGEYACFTRPEMKAERVSYDVMTPSAARGVLEAVYWKPSICWVVDKIHVLRPIVFDNVRRNEVADKIPPGTVSSAMKDGTTPLRLFVEDSRQQRAALVLRQVDYVIEAHFSYTSTETRTGHDRVEVDDAKGFARFCVQQDVIELRVVVRDAQRQLACLQRGGRLFRSGGGGYSHFSPAGRSGSGLDAL